MKELAKDGGAGIIKELSEKLTSLGLHTASLVCGFLTAGTSLIYGMSPLGVGFCAGVPMRYVLSAMFGALLGYILPFNGVDSFRFTAALLAVVVVRFIVGSAKELKNKPLFSAVSSALIMTGVCIAAAGDGLAAKGLLGLSEGLICGGSAYFIGTALKQDPFTSVMSFEQTASLIAAVNLLLTSIFRIAPGGVSFGISAAVLLILFTAKYAKAGMAAVCAVSAAAACCLSGGSVRLALCLCFTGLAACVFAPLGKIPLAFVTSSVPAVWVLMTAAQREAVGAFAASFVAGVIFLVIPRSIGARVGVVISPSAYSPDTDGLRKNLTMRLSLSALALRGVSDTVEDVARCLAITKKPSFANVLHEVENDACRGCSFLMYCWEKERKTTVDAVLAMSDAIRRGTPVSFADVPDAFAEKCLRIERFESSLCRYYADFLNSISAEKRVAEMREVVSDQMNGISDMLCELSEEFRTAQKYDPELAEKVVSAMKGIDIRVEECSCVTDRFGRITIEMKLGEVPEIPLNRARILSRIEDICDRDFEAPEVNRVGRGCYIAVSEKAVLSADCFVTQFNQGKNQMCGDTCRYFFDGRGRLITILSDGMGSGGRAAVDSAMTAGLAERLIKAGFGFDCTLRLVNSAMLFKSTDESLATLDISCVDLFTGQTELLKAGAAPTLVRRNGRTGRAECHSLPAGILREVGFDRAVVTLKEGDILLMMSDGVCSDGTDWICAEVEAFDGGAKQLTEKIATSARRRRSDGHDDDITVFAAIIEKAV